MPRRGLTLQINLFSSLDAFFEQVDGCDLGTGFGSAGTPILHVHGVTILKDSATLRTGTLHLQPGQTTGTGLFEGTPPSGGSSQASIPAEYGSTYSLRMAARAFGLPGDLNGDGYVCFADLVLFQTALGTSEGQPAFQRYADFDLDDTITATDTAYFLHYGTQNGCLVDVDCNHVLNPDDLGDFITIYFDSNPLADFNLDGILNPDDIGDFVTAYFQGC